MVAKTIRSITTSPGPHWVGDGFPVHGLFGYSGEEVAARSPFLLLDVGAATTFAPNAGPPRGVGQHPHRGFETVTLVYAGEVAHRDSHGGGGVIGPGDVQWMTAGSGLLHEEFHSSDYSRSGGPFEMVQLWVNLPARDKLTAPRYQAISAAQIPVRTLDDGKAQLRVIAGTHGDARGPAMTFTPLNLLDVRTEAGAALDLSQPDGWNTLVVVLTGRVRINGTLLDAAPAVATLSAAGGGVRVDADSDAKLLVLAGEPIDEPVVGHGPFVMNTRAEIAEAIRDFNSGRFGRMA